MLGNIAAIVTHKPLPMPPAKSLKWAGITVLGVSLASGTIPLIALQHDRASDPGFSLRTIWAAVDCLMVTTYAPVLGLAVPMLCLATGLRMREAHGAKLRRSASLRCALAIGFLAGPPLAAQILADYTIRRAYSGGILHGTVSELVGNHKSIGHGGSVPDAVAMAQGYASMAGQDALRRDASMLHVALAPIEMEMSSSYAYDDSPDFTARLVRNFDWHR
jgi:hypothetical protein